MAGERRLKTEKTARDWYAHPKYYEAIFGPDTDREMDFLESVNREHGTGGKRWLEPACGAGRLLEEGARRGYSLVGYDLSEPMLEHARARLGAELASRVQVHASRMEDFCPPALEGTFDFAFCLVSTFRYLDSEKAARSHLESVRRLLKPGGVYALGFHLTEYAREVPEKERWKGRVGREDVVCLTSEGIPDRAQRRSAMHNTLRIKGPSRAFSVKTDWFFRTYDLPQATRLFRSAGLRARAQYTFDYRLDQPVRRGALRLDRVFILQAG